MSKRSNPYVDDFVPQSKTHVSLKQFNNNKCRMQKVYEKTLELLYKGAKKLPEANVKSTEISIAKKDSMKQLLIDKDGTLINSKSIETETISSAKECHCGSSSAEFQCSYCEAALCSVCQHLCARCNYAFCSKCSLNGSEATVICVSCYG